MAGNAAFRALADGTRREILNLLRLGPRTSGEIADVFNSSWPTISRHLAVLREGGLVTSARRGQEIVYELDTSVFQELLQHLMEWAAAPSSVQKTIKKSGRRRAPQPREAS